MIEYKACIIRDGMTDTEIYQAIMASDAYYVLDARTSADKPLGVIFDEQKHRKIFSGIATPIPERSRRPKPIKI